MPSTYSAADKTFYTTAKWRKASGPTLVAAKTLVVDTGASITMISFANAAGKPLTIKGSRSVQTADGKTSTLLTVVSTCLDIDTEASGGGTPLTLSCCQDMVIGAMDLLGMDQMNTVGVTPWWDPATGVARLERR